MRITIEQPAWVQSKSSDDALQILLRQIRNTENFTSRQKPAQLITQDATVTQIWSDVMDTDTAWILEYRVVAWTSLSATTALPAMAGYHEIHRYIRGATSTAPVLRSNAAPVPDYEDVAAWAVTFAFSTDGTITMYVTGEAATIVFWQVVVDIIVVP